MIVQRWKWLVAACALLVACSNDASGTSSGSRGSMSGVGGRVTPNMPASDGVAGSFGNTGTMVQPTPVVMQPQQPKPMPIAGGIQPISIDDCGANNAAGLSAADATKLMAGGVAGSLRWLYPYDGTVFPRGMLAPMLMWDGATADSVYLHIKASAFEYKGCLKPTADGQLQLDQTLWDTAGKQTKGTADPYTVELSVMQAGTVTGPVSEQLTIAQATIKGSIYYNSYNSMLGGMMATMDPFGGMGGQGGKVLRIPPGGMAEVFESMDCNGCHSVSANGARLISQVIPGNANAYALAPDTPPNPPAMATNSLGAFGALYPDGSVYLEMSTVIDVGRTTLAAMGGVGGSTDAALHHTDDGSIVPNTGIPGGSLMPMFSPDGTKLAVNDYAINQAHGLALMDYDTATNSATNYRMLFTDTDMRPAWPFVLPDNGAVVFTRTDGANFSGEGLGIGGITMGPSSDLSIVDVASATVTVLAHAMGYATPDDAKAGTTYLPFGSEELHHNYFPTVSPVAAGGYFWLFFDSWRHYGNRGLQRALWGAAIDIAADGTYAVDRSHPPFYLPGQEFGTGNHRAFAALDPCKMDSDSCTSGTDCCGGFCYVTKPDDEFGEAVGSCTAKPPAMCSHTNEKCTSNADCCAPAAGQVANSCIAGFCAVLQPPS